jgi:hypothetical protein
VLQRGQPRARARSQIEPRGWTPHGTSRPARLRALTDPPMDTMDAMDNPVVSTELAEEATATVQQHDDEDMESGGGPINSEETVRLLVAVVDERIAGSQGDGSEQDGEGIGDLVAHLVRTEITPPSNFHQCTVYYLTSEAAEDADLRAAAAPVMLAGSYSMVFMQTATVISIWAGTLYRTCENNDMCPLKGQFCYLNYIGAARRCYLCGAFLPLPLQTDAEGNDFNGARQPNFVGYNTTAAAELCFNPVPTIGNGALDGAVRFDVHAVESWCDACFHVTQPGVAGHVDPMTMPLHAAGSVDAMGIFDWMALCFSFTTVAFAISGELQDIELCEIAVARARGGVKGGVRFALKFLNITRRWVFLPCLSACIPALVWIFGGDALSVCFNTVAILFLVEIDTVCYAGLPRRVRERMAEAGRLMLTEGQATSMARSKAVHVCAFVLIMIVIVTWRGEAPVHALMPLLTPSVPFIIGGCFEGCQQATPASALRDAAKSFAAGMIGFVVWFGVAYRSLLAE